MICGCLGVTELRYEDWTLKIYESGYVGIQRSPCDLDQADRSPLLALSGSLADLEVVVVVRVTMS